MSSFSSVVPSMVTTHSREASSSYDDLIRRLNDISNLSLEDIDSSRFVLTSFGILIVKTTKIIRYCTGKSHFDGIRSKTRSSQLCAKWKRRPLYRFEQVQRNNQRTPRYGEGGGIGYTREWKVRYHPIGGTLSIVWTEQFLDLTQGLFWYSLWN